MTQYPAIHRIFNVYYLIAVFLHILCHASILFPSQVVGTFEIIEDRKFLERTEIFRTFHKKILKFIGTKNQSASDQCCRFSKTPTFSRRSLQRFSIIAGTFPIIFRKISEYCRRLTVYNTGSGPSWLYCWGVHKFSITLYKCHWQSKGKRGFYVCDRSDRDSRGRKR